MGDTGDLETATCTNSIGATERIGSWPDDGFDPRQAALYDAPTLEDADALEHRDRVSIERGHCARPRLEKVGST